jgi:hypothetical protein
VLSTIPGIRDKVVTKTAADFLLGSILASGGDKTATQQYQPHAVVEGCV